MYNNETCIGSWVLRDKISDIVTTYFILIVIYYYKIEC